MKITQLKDEHDAIFCTIRVHEHKGILECEWHFYISADFIDIVSLHLRKFYAHYKFNKFVFNTCNVKAAWDNVINNFLRQLIFPVLDYDSSFAHIHSKHHLEYASYVEYEAIALSQDVDIKGFTDMSEAEKWICSTQRKLVKG